MNGEVARNTLYTVDVNNYLRPTVSLRSSLMSTSNIPDPAPKTPMFNVENENRLLLAMDAAGLGIYEWDIVTSEITWVNDRIYTIFGRSRAVGPLTSEKFLSECVHPEDALSIVEAAHRAYEQRTNFHYICRISAEITEEWRWVEFHGKFEEKDGALTSRMAGSVRDITERKCAELDQERFRDLGSDLQIISHTLGYFTWVSPSLARLLGRTVEEITTRPWAEFLHPDDAPASAQGSAELHKGKSIIAFENRFLHSDGHSIWLHWNASISPQEHTVYAVATNITERKQAEADQRFLMGLSDELSKLTDPLAMMHEVGRCIREYFAVVRCIFVDYDLPNDKAIVLYADQESGLPDLVGEYLLSAFATKETLQELNMGRQQVFPDMLRDQRTSVNRERVKAMGIGASITSPHVSDGICRHGISVHQKEAYDWSPREVGLLKDISARVWPSIERAQIGVRLRSSLHRLRLVTDSLPVLVSYLDRDHVYRFVNRRYTEWFNIQEEDIVGKHLKEVVGEQVYQASIPRIERVLSGEAFEYEDLHQYKVGDSKYVLVNYVPHMADDGTTMGWYALVQDITQRKLHDGSLKEEARRKDEFLATLSHELRNPLSPLRSALELLEMDVDGQDKQMAREVMKRQVDRMTHLIDDLMDISRISRNKIDLKRAQVDLAGVIHEAVEATHPLMKTEGHTVKVELPDQAITLFADDGRLVQVFTNLLSNAGKFTPAGGTIFVRGRAEDAVAIIDVKDPGIGIPGEDLERVFDMFTQVEPAPGKTRSGLGIGLNLVKDLVGMHGGAVTVQSPGPGKGSTFTVTLPLSGKADTCSPIGAAQAPV